MFVYKAWNLPRLEEASMALPGDGAIALAAGQRYDIKVEYYERGGGATLEEWLMAAEYIVSSGNPNVILCERGIRTFETYTRNTMDLAAVPLLHHLTHLPVIVDPSHAAGRRDLVEPLSLAAAAVGAEGINVARVELEAGWAEPIGVRLGAEAAHEEDRKVVGAAAEVVRNDALTPAERRRARDADNARRRHDNAVCSRPEFRGSPLRNTPIDKAKQRHQKQRFRVASN